MRIIIKIKSITIMALGLMLSSCDNGSSNEQVLSCVSVPSKFREGSIFPKYLDGFDDGAELIEIPIKYLRSTHPNLTLFLETKPEYQHGLRFVLTIQNPEKTRENTTAIFRTFSDQNMTRYKTKPKDVSFVSSLNLWKHNTSDGGKFFKLATFDLREVTFKDEVPINSMVGSCSFRGDAPFSIEITPYSCSASLVDNDTIIGMTLDSEEMKIREELFEAAFEYVDSWSKVCRAR